MCTHLEAGRLVVIHDDPNLDKPFDILPQQGGGADAHQVLPGVGFNQVDSILPHMVQNMDAAKGEVELGVIRSFHEARHLESIHPQFNKVTLPQQLLLAQHHSELAEVKLRHDFLPRLQLFW